MLWCDRRGLIVSGLAALGLGACGFAPVYGPGGVGRLIGQVRVDDPGTSDQFAFVRRFEERMGRPGAVAPFTLSIRLETDQQDLGGTSAGVITRYRIVGRADYALRETGADTPLFEARTDAFTGYSATGSTVATLAAERDASERLMVILADQVIDDLLLRAPDLPA